MSALDPRIRLSQHGNVVTGSGRVECRVRDALSECGGLLLTTMPPALAVRARLNGDRVGLSPGDRTPISVVICTRDRPAHIAACLEAVLAQRHSAGEIILIENAPSSDEAARLIRRYSVRHRIEVKPGLSHARNLGLAWARFDVIAFTDDDACGGMRKGAMPMQYDGATMSLSARMAAERLGVGANMAFRRAAFDRVGLFRCSALGRPIGRQKISTCFTASSPPASRFVTNLLRLFVTITAPRWMTWFGNWMTQPTAMPGTWRNCVPA
jgi:hypothetical protein